MSGKLLSGFAGLAGAPNQNLKPVSRNRSPDIETRNRNSEPLAYVLEEWVNIIQQRIEQAVVDLLEAIGEDPEREGLRETPQRVARMYGELFSGLGAAPQDAIDAVFEAESSDPVILRNVAFYSMCEHHLLPFFGSAHLAYVPNGKIAGISKLARALDVACHRPQVQERLTDQVADAIFAALNPRGVVIELEAEHLCMAMRGVKKPGSRVVTVAARGEFQNCQWNQESLLSLLRRNG